MDDLNEKFKKANKLYCDGDYKQAIVLFNDILNNLDPNTDEIKIAVITYNLGVACINIGEIDLAIGLFLESCNVSKFDLNSINNSFYNLGVCYYLKGNIHHSYKYFKKHLELCKKYNIHDDDDDTKNKLSKMKKMLIVKGE